MSTPRLARATGCHAMPSNAAPRTANDPPHQHRGRHQERQAQVVVVATGEQVDPEDGDIITWNPDSSRSLGELFLVVEHQEHQQVERQRHECQPRALHSQGGEPDQHAEHHAGQAGDGDRQQERYVRKCHSHAADGNLAASVEQHRRVGPDPQEPRLSQGDLSGETVDEVRPDADDAEHREQAQVEQRRVRPPDREHNEERKAPRQRHPLDDDPGPGIHRHEQVEGDDGENGRHPQPHDSRELRSPEGEHDDKRRRQDGHGDESPRNCSRSTAVTKLWPSPNSVAVETVLIWSAPRRCRTDLAAATG